MARHPRPLKGIDPTRLGMAGARPGNDPRTWVGFGKIKAVTWDGDSGALVSVDMKGGPLDGETDVVCSVSPAFAKLGAISSTPLQIGATAVIVLPEGDANVDPQVIAWSIGPDVRPAAKVAGQSVADLFQSSHFLGDAEHEANVELKQLRVVADPIKLVVAEPSQAFVRGNDFTDALKEWLDATSSFATTVQTASTAASAACVGPLTPLKAFFDALTPAVIQWKADVASFKAKLVPGQALSKKLFAE